MAYLSYVSIKKTLDELYNEHAHRGLPVDEYIGRTLYEFEGVIDPEEGRPVESFFFHMGVLKKMVGLGLGDELRTLFPEAVDFIMDQSKYAKLCADKSIEVNEFLLIKEDYKMLRYMLK